MYGIKGQLCRLSFTEFVSLFGFCRVLFQVKKVITETLSHAALEVIIPFFVQRGKKSWTKFEALLQELEEGPRGRPYLLVFIKI